jgi:2-polyprenyl-3-methyl-5-hydroxy-6-metoxy-1,4-benzoquinol methylase
MNCRFDGQPLTHVFADLGFSPPSNSFLTKNQLQEGEISYPLKLYVSERTFLVQLGEFKKATDIFNDEYIYYSSYSTSWLAHCQKYTENVVERFNLSSTSLVIEVASNDGYLLQYFKEKNVPVLGIEPTKNTALVAQGKGIETITEFFGESLARQLNGKQISADLLIGNNVLAHVPDLNDFIRGVKIMLAEDGVATFEFPHLLKLIEQNQFDTIYHEHFSYFLLYTVRLIFGHHGLEIFDVEELPTHGGSLRIYAAHKESRSHSVSDRVYNLVNKERDSGLLQLDIYNQFHRKMEKVKLGLLEFLVTQKKNDKKVWAYGAAAKGNTLLNYSGIYPDLIQAVADLSPHKQGKFLPGSHIPVVSPEAIYSAKPDYMLILPWNIKQEIIEQLSFIKDWGARFVVPIPELTVL